MGEKSSLCSVWELHTKDDPCLGYIIQTLVIDQYQPKEDDIQSSLVAKPFIFRINLTQAIGQHYQKFFLL